MIAVGCGDAALLAGGDSGAADGLAGPRPSMRDGEAAATPASDRRRTRIRQLSGTSVRYKTPAVGARLGTFTGHCWDPTTRTLTSRLRTLAGLQCACGRPAADTHDRRGATVPPNRVVRYAGHPSVRASHSVSPWVPHGRAPNSGTDVQANQATKCVQQLAWRTASRGVPRRALRAPEGAEARLRSGQRLGTTRTSRRTTGEARLDHCVARIEVFGDRLRAGECGRPLDGIVDERAASHAFASSTSVRRLRCVRGRRRFGHLAPI